MKKCNPLLFYFLDIFGASLLIGLIVNVVPFLEYVLWGILILLAVVQYVFMQRSNLGVYNLILEDFDELDEREVAAKGKLHRILVAVNSHLLLILASIIAAFPYFKIDASFIGISICSYFILRAIVFIGYNLKIRG